MNGVIIGRFMPPHRGHQYLVEFGHNYVDHLYVLVCTLASEPIPGELRYRWMQELFPRDHIIHITEEIPEASRGTPNAEQIWAESVRNAVNAPVDHVFASESYGASLADALGAHFVPVDPAREIFPVSASLIRNDPYLYWRYIPEPVRPYFTYRVAVVAGSKELHPTARLLAEAYDSVFVNDYARFAAAEESGDTADTAEVRRAQHAAEEALARHARRLLFCERDTSEYDELSRYDLIIAEETDASPEARAREAVTSRLEEAGLPVIRFNGFSESDLRRIRETIDRRLLRPGG